MLWLEYVRMATDPTSSLLPLYEAGTNPVDFLEGPWNMVFWTGLGIAW